MNLPGKPRKLNGGEKPIFLSLAEAKRFVKRYNCNKNPEDKNERKAHYFSRKALEGLLRQSDNVVGIRVYYSINDKYQMEALLMAVDSEGNNVIDGSFEHAGEKGSFGSGVIASALPCPNHCPPKGETDPSK